MKLVAPFETSSERTEERRIILAEVLMDGVIGWGECVAGERPFYSPETTDTAPNSPMARALQRRTP